MDHPGINDTQVKQVIPLLMQDLYKQMGNGDMTVSINKWDRFFNQLIAWRLKSYLIISVIYGFVIEKWSYI